MSAFDVMPNTELYQPVTVEDAVALASRLAEKGWLVGGGQDTYGWLKDRAKSTQAMIELTHIAELSGIKKTSSGLEIGATTTLTEISGNPLVRQLVPLLGEAASHVASPQIRNVGTIAGNIAQDTRCWYYRRGLDCYRAGGNLCYADTPEGLNREHCLFGASRCVAVSPSDTAPALLALDASIVYADSDGMHSIAAADFFLGPDVDITRMNILKPGQIIVSIVIPVNPDKNMHYYFEKVADRNVWDFALVNIAVALELQAGSIMNARFVCAGVDCKPYRLKAVEKYCVGRSVGEKTAEDAAALAAIGAVPLNHNQFKITLMQNLVRRALRGQS